MEFDGAEDYYFWDGIETGQVAPKRALDSVYEDVMDLGHDMSRLCREAYVWGFLWGRELTSLEYLDMIGKGNETLCANIVVNVDTTNTTTTEEQSSSDTVLVDNELQDLLNKEFPLKGNC